MKVGWSNRKKTIRAEKHQGCFSPLSNTTVMKDICYSQQNSNFKGNFCQTLKLHLKFVPMIGTVNHPERINSLTENLSYLIYRSILNIKQCAHICGLFRGVASVMTLFQAVSLCIWSILLTKYSWRVLTVSEFERVT